MHNHIPAMNIPHYQSADSPKQIRCTNTSPRPFQEPCARLGGPGVPRCLSIWQAAINSQNAIRITNANLPMVTYDWNMKMAICLWREDGARLANGRLLSVLKGLGGCVRSFELRSAGVVGQLIRCAPGALLRQKTVFYPSAVFYHLVMLTWYC